MKRVAFFVDADNGRRFALLSKPSSGVPRGCIVYVHPFAEEMNKSRRMVALAARAFAEHGWCVLQIDHFGCGDSSGDFSDASWQSWVADLTLGFDYAARLGDAPVVLWCLRAGALVTADWLAQNHAQPPLLLWQPVLNGKQHLTQFLRLKAASEMLGEADAKAVIQGVRASLASGRPVEVAGYGVSSALTNGLEAARFRLPPAYGAPVALFEVTSGERTEHSPATATLLHQWREAAVRATTAIVNGPAFWQTQEIETVPGLIGHSLTFLDVVAG